MCCIWRLGGREENRIEGGGAVGGRKDGEWEEGGGGEKENTAIGGGDEEEIVVERECADGGVVEYRGWKLLEVKRETE